MPIGPPAGWRRGQLAGHGARVGINQGSISPSPAITTANGRSVCKTRMVEACSARTSGRRRYAIGLSSKSAPIKCTPRVCSQASIWVRAKRRLASFRPNKRPGEGRSVDRQERRPPGVIADRGLDRLSEEYGVKIASGARVPIQPASLDRDDVIGDQPILRNTTRPASRIESQKPNERSRRRRERDGRGPDCVRRRFEPVIDAQASERDRQGRGPRASVAARRKSPCSPPPAEPRGRDCQTPASSSVSGSSASSGCRQPSA